MKYFFNTFLLISILYFSNLQISFGQPLTDGMAVITHSTQFGNEPAFQIFEAGNNANAPTGSGWSTNIYTPSNSSIYNQWFNIGTVFGIAIDLEKNIYLSALPIMYGTASVGSAGAAGIYKVDKDDWSITNFVTTGNGINQIPNSGTGIGNVCYDKYNNQLFATNLDDGKIYRFDMDGTLLSTFDPFSFDNSSPGFAGFGEAIWAINIYAELGQNPKIYFSRIDNASNNPTIWSIDLDNNGDFIGSEEFCFTVTGGVVSTISDLTFDSQMNMYLAERGQNNFTNGGSYYTHQSRGLKYKFENNNWVQEEVFYVGSYGYGANTAGGVALSDKKNAAGDVECDGYAWFSGDALTGCCEIYGATAIPPNVGNTINNSLFVDIQNLGSAYSLSKGSFGDIEVYTSPKSVSIVIDSISYKCENIATIQLEAEGAVNYVWSPASDLNSQYISDPISSSDTNITYTVIGELCSGIVDTATTTVTIVNSMIDTLSVDISDYNGYNISCYNSSDGWILLDSSLLAYDINWSNGENGIYINNLTAGNYSVEITDTFGCVFNFSFDLISPDQLVNNLQSSDYNSYGVSCPNSNDGFIISDTYGGIPPYTFNWSNNLPTNQNVYELYSGYYSVSITDLNNCDISNTIYLSEPPPIISQDQISNYKGYNISCHDSTDGWIEVNLIGGVQPYDFNWSNGNTSLSNLNLSAGVYYLEVVDENDCYYFESYNLIQPNEIITSIVSLNDFNGFDISCNGLNDGEIQLNVTGGNPDYTINWNTGQQTQLLQNIYFGEYIVSVSDMNGCFTADTITLTEPDALVSTIESVFDYNGYDISCYGQSDGAINLDVVGGVLPYGYSWNEGSNTEDLNNLIAGQYTVDITDANNCQQTASILLDEPSAYQTTFNVSDYNGFNISCFGSSDAWIDQTTTGSVPPYIFNWSNGESSEDLSSLSVGSYDLTITDLNSCESVISFNLNEPTALQTDLTSLTNFNGFDVSCNGNNEGSIQLNISGSVSPYTILWSTGESTDIISSLGASQYDVLVTDDNGCFTTDTITLTEPDALVSTIESVFDYNGYDISCYGQSDGAINLDVVGGVLPYGYSWNEGSNTEDLNNLITGQYTVDITDANNCQQTASILLDEPSAYQTTFNVSDYNGFNISCFGSSDAWIDQTTTGSVPPYIFNWSNGESSEDLSSLSVGSYDLTITDLNSCESVISFNLNEPTALQTDLTSLTNFNGFDISCNGNNEASIQLNISGSVSPYTILWSTGESTDIISSLGASQYDVLVTDDNGCFTTDTITLTEPDALVSAISSVFDYNGYDISCYGQSDGAINLDVVGGVLPYGYSWNEGSNTEDLNNLIAGQYTVDITDANNCQQTASILLDEPSAYQTTFNVSDYNGFNISCFGSSDAWIDQTTTGSVPPYIFNWSNGESSEDLSSLSVGSYDLTITDLNSCESVISFNLNEPTALQTDLTSLTNFNGFDVSCNGNNEGSIQLNISGSVSPYTILWSTGESTDIISSLGASQYDVLVTDDNGCFTTDTITLTEPDALVSTIESVFDYNGYDISCYGQSDGAINLDVVGGVQPYGYSWNNGINSQDLNQISEGYYQVNIIDNNNCIISNQINLIEPTQIELSLELSNYDIFNLSCFESNDGYINSNVIGSVPPYLYSWSTGDNTPSINNLSSGTYSLLVTDANSCIISSSSTLTEPNDFFVTLDFTTDTCDKGVGTASLYITPQFNSYQIYWSNGEISSSINNLNSGQHEVEVLDPYNCSKSYEFYIDNINKPIASFSTIPLTDGNIFQIESIIDFEDQSIDDESTIVTWNWNFGDGNSSDRKNTSHYYENSGEYLVILEVENLIGCTDTASKVINVGAFNAYIPNTFTPTADTKNDVFSISGEGIVEFELSIYNRWGKDVFKSVNEGWNGLDQNNNQPSIQGVYIYQFIVKDIFDQYHEFIGDVTLME